MNINLIKAELEKLLLMLSSWENEQSVSAIERDIALDKLKSLYDLVRFDSEPQSIPTPVVPVAEPEPAVEQAAEDEEKDVEVELIFAEDDDMFTLPTEEDNDEEEGVAEEAESPISLASEILASAIGATAVKEVAEEAEPVAELVVEPATEPIAEVEIEAEKDEEEVTAEEPAISVVEEVAEVAEEESAPEEIIPEPTPEPEPVAEPEPEPTPEPVIEREEPKSLNNLFGMEEVKRRPRTKHQRMMSIYSDSEPRQEKVVDISKIFNMEIDAPIPMTSKIADFTPEPEPAPAKPVAAVTPEPTVEAERPKTLADAISPSTPTLADTLAVPTALGEEIHNSRIASLRDGIGLNDKFLMIRDLFDGDADAYNEAIAALDELETMDDCMIHIIENYAWNPDSEGSKFIMQLLERKLS